MHLYEEDIVLENETREKIISEVEIGERKRIISKVEIEEKTWNLKDLEQGIKIFKLVIISPNHPLY